MRVAFQEFNEIIGRIEGTYHEAAVKLHLSDSEMDILYILQSYPDGCNQSVLYKKSGSTKSTVNTALKKMERNDLIVIRPGAGRNTWVSLTETGCKRIEDTVGRVIQMENEIYDSWTEREQAAFIQLSRDYAEKLKKMVDHM